MTSTNEKSQAELVWIGYFIAGGTVLLTFFHLGLLALVLSIPGIIVLQNLLRKTDCVIIRSHLKWQIKTLLVFLLVMGGLIAWLVFEVGSIDASNFIQIFASHWVAHTVMSILLSIWMLVRIVRGILRFSDNSAIV